MTLYALTIFLSAALLFLLQPMIGKFILPWFGGAANVWVTCLLFFQGVLLLGYFYAHRLIARIPYRRQKVLHIALLAASLLALPVLPDTAWKPVAAGDPTLRILALLAATVGLPYLLLAATTPLVQGWLARLSPAEKPYRLYAISNAGSLLGLVSYPFLVEPFFSVRAQAWIWSVGYAVFCLLCLFIALRQRGDSLPWETESSVPGPVPRPALSARLLWVGLAACGSALLLAVTNHLTHNIAPVPLLWVLPLSLYLVTFILSFHRERPFSRAWLLRWLALALGSLAYALAPEYGNVNLRILIPLFCAGMFVCCLFCHSELARMRPPAEHMTSFYLMLSLGGFLGGVFVVVVAPHTYPGYFELPAALGVCAVLALLVLRHDPHSQFYRARWQPAWLGLIALVGLLLGALLSNVRQELSLSRVQVRNFYGMIRVMDEGAARIIVEKDGQPTEVENEKAVRKLVYGTIDHGLQYRAAERRRRPTSYYGEKSGIGRALRFLERQGPLRVGVVGLGTGSLAVYGRTGDRYTFYEINPLVTQLANSEFTYLRDGPAQMEVIHGDARLVLERQPSQQFDLLVVDAFSGDAIPVHLLTREAFALYFRHLKPGGVLAFHISNNYLNLEPVVQGAAESLGKTTVVVHNESDRANAIFRATWVLVSGRTDLFDDPALRAAGKALHGGTPRLWTDDHSDLLRVLK